MCLKYFSPIFCQFIYIGVGTSRGSLITDIV